MRTGHGITDFDFPPGSFIEANGLLTVCWKVENKGKA